MQQIKKEHQWIMNVNLEKNMLETSRDLLPKNLSEQGK